MKYLNHLLAILEGMMSKTTTYQTHIAQEVGLKLMVNLYFKAQQYNLLKPLKIT